MITHATAYLVLHGPVTQQEGWEGVNAEEIIARFTAAGIDQYELAADLQREATKVIHQRLERDDGPDRIKERRIECCRGVSMSSSATEIIGIN